MKINPRLIGITILLLSFWLPFIIGGTTIPACQETEWYHVAWLMTLVVCGVVGIFVGAFIMIEGRDAIEEIKDWWTDD